jgi:UDP-N-acetylmuramate--alanine ligase
MIVAISLQYLYNLMIYNDILITKVHFVGIAGVGMSGLAQLLKEQGIRVTGSDRDATPVTDLLESRDITVLMPQVAENVPPDSELVIYSDAVPEGNPERVFATENFIPQISYFQGLGLVSEGKRTIAVAGTHGKTTTTGMIARILADTGASPTAIVGSIVKDFHSNYLAGTSDIFVVEACEYRRHFLNLYPHIFVITNIEYDHTDYFRDLIDVQDAFRTLIERVPAEGFIVTDVQNPNIASLLLNAQAQVIDYKDEKAYPLRLPGEFNQDNARAAAAAARVILPDAQNEAFEEQLAKSLSDFHGTWRRFEHKGKSVSGAEVYDDYAHHPTAIMATLAEVKRRTTGKVFVAFHPHLFSRTRDLFEGFSRAFVDADRVLLAPIYAAREIDDGTISSTLLAEHMRALGTDATAFDSFEDIEQALFTAQVGDTIITMGAGDIYKIADALVAPKP